MENNEKGLPAQMRETLERLTELGVEPYPRRSPVVLKTLDGGSHRSPRLQNIIDQDDVPSVHIEGDVGRTDLGIRERGRRVISIEGDIDGTDRRRRSFGFRDLVSDSHRETDATPTNAHEREVFVARGRFQNRYCHASDAASDSVRIEDDLLGSSHGRRSV